MIEYPPKGGDRMNSMFYDFKLHNQFYHDYLFFFIDRFVYTSIDVENDNDSKIRRNKKINLLEAFKYVLNIEGDTPNVWEIQQLGDLINKNEEVPQGFRRIQVSAGAKAEFIPVPPREIYNRLYYLLDNYKNGWCDLDVFEKEAMFHIEFMRIHPFEDGNKRTAKTILNRNLIFQNKAPVIIDDAETDLYYDFINNCDYIGFAKFLETKSRNEFTNMVGLYKMQNRVSVDVEGTTLTRKK